MRANLLGSLPALDPALAWLIAIALAVLLLASALHKLRDLPGFEAVLSDYDLLPARATGLVPVVARTVVAAELMLAVALLVPDAAPWAGPATALLLGMYALAIAINLRRGRRDIDCGCLGPGAGVGTRHGLSPWLVARNLLLMSLAAAHALPVAQRSLHWLDAITGLGALLVLAWLWQAAHLLIAHDAFRQERFS
jgi:hypothetical protein